MMRSVSLVHQHTAIQGLLNMKMVEFTTLEQKFAALSSREHEPDASATQLTMKALQNESEKLQKAHQK